MACVCRLDARATRSCGKSWGEGSFRSYAARAPRLPLLLRVRRRRVSCRLPGEEAPLAVFLAPDGEVVDVVHGLLAAFFVAHVDVHAAHHQDDARPCGNERAFLVIEVLVAGGAGEDALDLRGLVVDLAA